MQLLAVVVRYKIPLADSETLNGLADAFGLQPELLTRVGVLVWDNSPDRLDQPQLPFPFEYHHTAENLGVSGAYNRAMKIAEERRIPWLLLLDQDTSLPQGFLHSMLACCRAQEGNASVAAIAPFLFDGERAISPIAVGYAGNKPISAPFVGIYPKNLFAANSGTVMRVSSLREVGGYDERFWLDLSDVVVFHRLWSAGYRTFVLGDLHVQHRVTNNDYDGSMSPQRYENFILAEGAYWDMCRTELQNLVQTLRLFARTLRQYRRYRNKTYSRITFAHFLTRIFCSRRARLESWEKSLSQRNMPQVVNGQVVG